MFSVLISYEITTTNSTQISIRLPRVQTKQEDSYPINFCTYSPAAFQFHLVADLHEVDKVLLMLEVSGGAAEFRGQFLPLPNSGRLYQLNSLHGRKFNFQYFHDPINERERGNATHRTAPLTLSETLSNKLFLEREMRWVNRLLLEENDSLTVSTVYTDFPKLKSSGNLFGINSNISILSGVT
ncbi:MAG: hypothetical protein IPF54_25505 [Draconibacterium sp.]|nr:hypothetical protein [Draconibacterium sp.]